MTRSEIIGENIRKYRTSVGMSQVDFAAAIGKTQGTISLYEKGQRLPATQTIAKIAKVLGTSFGALYFSDSERDEPEEDYDDPMVGERYTYEERHLIDVYRLAIPEIRKAALQMLEMNPAIQKENRA